MFVFLLCNLFMATFLLVLLFILQGVCVHMFSFEWCYNFMFNTNHICTQPHKSKKVIFYLVPVMCNTESTCARLHYN